MSKFFLLFSLFSSLALSASCPYFQPSACLKEAQDALKVRLSIIQPETFKIGSPSVFCGALDNADSETILYKYKFLKISAPNSLNLKAEVEITLNSDECVMPTVTILN